MAVLWRQDLSIGVEQIDHQHKELFARINHLLNACTEGKGREEVGGVIGFLEEYVVTHFGHEEALMADHGYPEMREHKSFHAHFIQEFNLLKERFEKEGATIYFVIQVNQVVVDWLVGHIQRVDKKLGLFLQGREQEYKEVKSVKG